MNDNTLESLRKAGRKYWCEFFKRRLKGNAVQGRKTLQEVESLAGNREQLREVLERKEGYGRFRAFYEYVVKKEKHTGPFAGERLFREIWNLMKKTDVFHCDEE